MNVNISIIIPNYNGEKLLQQNLPKVLDAFKGYKKGSVEIIVADDASSDNSVTVIATFISGIKEKYIKGRLVKNENSKERGFSKNMNRGVGVATGEILILLNTDVTPHKNFLSPLLRHFDNEKVFAVGCMDESKEDGRTILRGRGVGQWSKGFLQHGAGSLDRENTLWVSCGSGAFRKSLWDKLGGLNELFNPFYWEDIDLSYRAQKAGYLTLFENESKVIHEHSKGSIQINFKPMAIQKIAYRNQFIFVWVNITDIFLLVNHLLWFPYHLINALRSRERAFLEGFFLALMRLPKVLQYRNKMIPLFRISDKKILQKFSK